MAMLDVKDLNVYYGKIHAIKNISLTVEEGELVSLIGGKRRRKDLSFDGYYGPDARLQARSALKARQSTETEPWRS